MKLSKFGDWTKAGQILQILSSGSIIPAFQAQITSDGELILKTLKGHIDRQDLNWTPLSNQTIELKNGSEKIYVETGFLKENLKVRKIRSPKNGITYFIGADAWTTHKPSGLKFSDLMIYLEYGTSTIPPRPLIRPTMEELEPIIKKHWKELIKDLVKGEKPY